MMTSLIRLTICLSLIIVTGCASRGSFSQGDFSQVGDAAPQLSDQAQVTPRRIIILGGNRGIGLETTRLALARGHHVTVVSRNPSTTHLKHQHLSLVAGNVLSQDAMASVIPEHDVVILAVGLPPGSRNVTLFSRGISNIIPVMVDNHIDRLITISAIGAGDSQGHGGFWFDWFLQPFILDSDIRDKERKEAKVQTSSLDYTIVRPAILSDEPGRNRYRVIQDYDGVETGKISRKDVAHFLIAAVEQNLYIRQTVTLSD